MFQLKDEHESHPQYPHTLTHGTHLCYKNERWAKWKGWTVYVRKEKQEGNWRKWKNAHCREDSRGRVID